jgi:hypothetical protein
MVPKKQFEAWMRHQIFVDTDGGPCTKFVVKHVTGASKVGNIVMSLDVPQGEWSSDDWIRDNILMIEQTTSSDAMGSGGTQSYIVQSFHGESKDKSSGRFMLKMQGDPDADDDEVSTEPATGKGLLAQMMRHTEAMMRTSSLSQATIMNAMQRTLAQQSQTIEKLVDEKFNNIATVETLLSQKNERDIETMKAQKSFEMKEKAFDTLRLVAPTIMNKLITSGNPKNVASAQAVSSRDMQLASLADTISEEQLMKLQTVFTTDQLLLFVDVFTQIKQQQTLIEESPNK